MYDGQLVLLQKQEPAIHAGTARRMTKAERNYIPLERELLAFYGSVSHRQTLLEGQPIIIWSDHQPLHYMTEQVKA